jgi:hypothetical protein
MGFVVRVCAQRFLGPLFGAKYAGLVVCFCWLLWVCCSLSMSGVKYGWSWSVTCLLGSPFYCCVRILFC